MSVNRKTEDRWFEAKVMAAFRLSHGGRYFTEELLSDEAIYAGEIYRIIDRNVSNIDNPRLICMWPYYDDNYGHKVE